MSGEIKPGAWERLQEQDREQARSQQEAREEARKLEEKRLRDLQKQPEKDAKASLEALERDSRAAFLAQGGTEEEFKEAWPRMKGDALRERTQQKMTERERLAHKPRL